MTCDGRIGGSGFNFFNPINTGKTNNTANTGKANEVASTPIQITGSNTTTRADLDNLSPYASLGVNISAAAKDPVDIARQAAPEFAQFTGNYTLENPVEANYDLADLNFALQARTEEGLNRFVDGHTNRALAEKHLQDGGFANFLEQLDMAVS
jgi:hypothetical protein